MQLQYSKESDENEGIKQVDEVSHGFKLYITR